MPLDASLKDQLKTHLEKVTHPVELAASLDDGAKSTELLELLEEIASLSDLITVARVDGVVACVLNDLGVRIGQVGVGWTRVAARARSEGEQDESESPALESSGSHGFRACTGPDAEGVAVGVRGWKIEGSGGR